MPRTADDAPRRTVRDHLTEPWGIVAALFLGGMGGAVAAAVGPSAATAVLVATAIAAVVYGVQAGLSILADRPRATGSASVPTDAQVWLERAGVALGALQRHAGREAPARRGGAPSETGVRAGRIVGQLDRRAVALGVIDRELAGADPAALRREQARLQREQAAAGDDDALRAARAASLRSVARRIDYRERQQVQRRRLLATMESTVLHLEAAVGLASLLATQRAVADTSGDPADDVRALTDELEAAQAGLEETEELTRRLLGAA